jgi:predicted TPR repeat methyltransferase
MDTLEQARDFFVQGVRHFEAGRFAQARLQFEASLALAPGRPATLTNLGATRLKLGHLNEAAAILDEAIRVDPGNVEARGHRTMVLVELGRHTEALACVDEVLRLDGRMAPLWTLRGNLLRDLGRPQEAASSFRAALEHGGDAALNGYYLAALTGTEAPPAPPRAYVQALFDGYAQGFEDHLVTVLHYRAPDILAHGLQGRRFDRVIDLGCGTGLCGELIRGQARHLVGVDLSLNMVRQARARGVYDAVVHADILEFLADASNAADLVLAADVFIYVGALEAAFAAVQKVLAPRGVFAFSVELASDAQGLALRPSLRYAHSRAYIEALAERNGFDFIATTEQPIREDQGTPVAGLFVWLVKR